MLFFPCRSYVSTILPQVHKKYKKPVMTKIWWMHLIPSSLLPVSSVHLCFLILTIDLDSSGYGSGTL